ncbi:MAG: L-2-amino-thiazoline-4-carboxylic acid hydrolase [Spirochaetales bacterium]|nr:L-2-amino-thiazoline-4-carboxylic acid hydrolase [Spirochaetales bacterium]
MADVESNVTVLLSILDIRQILKKNIKASWLLLILKSFITANNLFKKSKWADKSSTGSKYAKSIFILAGIYITLKRKADNEKAFRIMKEIVMKLSYTMDYSMAKKHLFFEISDPFQRWIRYRSVLITEGFGVYNEIEDVYISNERIHYTVKRCIFHDVFTAAKTPELTALICDYDQTFHGTVFKEYYFDRNGSWNNTIGHGADICHYVWKHRDILTKEFKAYLESEKNKSKDEESGTEKRKQIRRQFDRRQSDRRRFDRRKGSRREGDHKHQTETEGT